MIVFTGVLFCDYSHDLDYCERPRFMTVYCEKKIIYYCFAIFQMKTLYKTKGHIFIKALCLYVFKCVPNSFTIVVMS